MTHAKLKDVLREIEHELSNKGYKPLPFPTNRPFTGSLALGLHHAMWLAIEAQTLDFTKAQRWLGFIQGLLFVCGGKTIDELKDMNSKDK